MYKVKGNLRHNGQDFKPKDVIQEGFLSETEATALLEAETIELIEHEGNESAPVAVPQTAPVAPAPAPDHGQSVKELPSEVNSGLRYFTDAEAGEVIATQDMDSPYSQIDQSKAGRGKDFGEAFADWQKKQIETDADVN